MNEEQTRRHVERLLGVIKRIQPDKKYKWDDQGLSSAFGALHANFCRYNQTAKEWFVYSGKVWEIDPGGIRTAEYVKAFITAMRMYAITLDDEQQSYDSFIKKYGQYTSREHLMKDARSVNHFVTLDLDRNADLFNCKNGTLNLRTGQFRKHNPTDLLSRISNVQYDKTASSEVFEKFISEIMQNDQQKIDYLQKILGYALTADPCWETCWFLYGATTRNGKGTLCETIGYMMGGTKGYANTAQPETLAQKDKKDSSKPSEDLARLNGCRFLNVSEPPKRMLLDAALFKQLTGKDTITARFLNQNSFEFTPCFKLFINTNYLPIISDDTVFSSDRINVITFDRHFSQQERDRALKQKLRKERNISGAFNWCFEGLKRFMREGAEPPESVRNATESYRKSCDKIGKFISDTLIVNPNKCIAAGSVYDLYKVWCRDAGYGTESKGNFFEDLKSRGIFQSSGTVNGKTVRNVVAGFEKPYDTTDCGDDVQNV